MAESPYNKFFTASMAEQQQEKKTAEPRLVVIMPTYNRWYEARIALTHLLQSDYQNFEIVLIEDGCTDETVDSCRRDFPAVKLLHGDGNLWWSGAINMGIDYALQVECDLVLWINDDNRVEPQTLSRMVESFKRIGEQSVICARVKPADGSEQDEWIGNPPRWHKEFGKWTPPDLSVSEVLVQHPPGGRGVLFPSKCFAEVGRVDNRAFPHYWADHDFHYRAMKVGYQYYLATGATLRNVPNKSRTEFGEVFTLQWSKKFLFDRRSPMNMPTLMRLLKRHLPPKEYQRTFIGLYGRTLTWLACGWAAKHKVIHASLRAIKRRISLKAQ